MSDTKATSDTSAVAPVAGIKVSVGGSPVELMNIALVEVETSLRVPAMATIAFLDPEHSIAERMATKLNTEVEVTASPTETDTVVLFKGDLTAVELSGASGPSTTAIRCVDKSRRLYAGRRSRTFLNVTYSDVVSQVASAAGLRAAVEDTATVFSFLVQHNETDGEFLERLAAECGYLLYLDVTRTQLVFAAPKPPESSVQIPTAGRAGKYQLMYGEDLVAFEVSAGPPLVTSVKTHGWNYVDKQQVVGVAEVDRGARFAAMGVNAPAVAQSESSLAPMILSAQTDADVAAKAVADHLSAATVRFRGRILGNPFIAAGVEVAVGGGGTVFNGHYRVTSCRQTFRDGGFLTEVVCDGLGDRGTLAGVAAAPQPIASAGLNRVPWAVTAIVTNNTDPDRHGRVKVKFPTLGMDTVESAWLRVVTPGAGHHRGISWLPEVNDEVVVVFEQGDMRAGYVLGGLYNGMDHPPDGLGTPSVADGKVEKRAITTRVGHQLLFDDTSGSESIEIHTGKTKIVLKLDEANEVASIDVSSGLAKMTMDGHGKAIRLDCASGDIVLKADNVTIEATTNVDIKGLNVTTDAKTNATVKAGAQASVESSGTATVKGNGPVEVNSSAITTIAGSLVKIN